MWLMGGNSGPVLNDIYSSSDGTNWTLVTNSAAWPAKERFRSGVLFNEMGIYGNGPGVWGSPDGTNWSQLTNGVLGSRDGHGMAVHNDRIYVISGTNLSSDVWESPDGRNWIPVNSSGPFASRQGIQAEVFNGNLWLVGGLAAGTRTNDVWYASDPPPVLPHVASNSVTGATYPTVQFAVAAVQNNATIYLLTNYYTNGLVVFNQTNIVITKDPSISGNITFAGPGFGPGASVFFSESIVLSNITATNWTQGVFIDSSSMVKVHQSTFTMNDVGLQITNANFLEVKDSSFDANTNTGALFLYSTSNTVDNSTFNNNEVTGMKVVNMTGITVQGSSLSSNFNRGIDMSDSTGLLIESNAVSYNGNEGIDAFGGTNTYIFNNIFNNDTNGGGLENLFVESGTHTAMSNYFGPREFTNKKIQFTNAVFSVDPWLNSPVRFGGDTVFPNPVVALLWDRITSSSIDLSWMPSADQDFLAYRLFRTTNSSYSNLSDNQLIATLTNASNQGYSDTGVTSGETYTYFITGVDVNSNESLYSVGLTVHFSPNGGLKAHFTFDATIHDTTANLYQSVNFGSVATNGRFGNANSARFFDGVDDYITNGQLPNFDDNLEDYSYSVWLKTETNNGTVFLQTHGTTSEPYSSLRFLPSVTNIGWLNRFFSGSTTLEATNTNVLSSQWNHVAAVKEGVSYSLYVNGQLVSTEIGAFPGAFNTRDRWIFGAGNTAATIDSFWRGTLDDVQVYDRPLSPIEVAELAAKPTMAVFSNNFELTNGSTFSLPDQLVNVTNSFTFTISNTGLQNLLLTSGSLVFFSGPAGSSFTLTSPPTATVSANGQTTFSFDFHPTSSGLNTAFMTIANNDFNTGFFQVTLQANVRGPVFKMTFDTGVAVDSSGSGNTVLAITATPTTDRYGAGDKAFEFDGVNDFIRLTESFFSQFHQ